METYDAFISYQKRHQNAATKIKALLSLNDRRVFLDADDIAAGVQWPDRIEEAIAASSMVVVLWCCDAAQSRWVKREYRQALGLGKTIVPVRLCRFALPDLLAIYQWIDLSAVVDHPCEHSEPDGQASWDSGARSDALEQALDDYRGRVFETADRFETLDLVLRAVISEPSPTN